MSLALPPDVDALATRLGLLLSDLSGVERARASAALADATALALDEVAPHVAADWSLGAPASVHVIILKAARREYENPQGLRSETVGEHGVTIAFASGVYLTEPEKRSIRRAATGRVGGFVGTVRTPSAYAPETPS
ncbi:hypothetical protein [Demequina muriae]|uniref:Phage protein Gp19/Gp15/Gp42 n=1 Tax=Demequina muriae TaxID=3051664 RepID=A0ABT8GEY7_9MICO|nr:hypothetical protein [Demequina sp. EGI L300058]MDN4479904.1 hypothetical protein [Demequina sp. EGI L300058]